MRKVFTLIVLTLVCTLFLADSQPTQKGITGIDKVYKPKTLPEQIDSLELVLKIAKEDTNKVNILTDLAYKKYQNAPDECIILGEQALRLTEKLNWQKGKAKSLRMIGLGNLNKGKNDIALPFFEQALKIGKELKDNQIISDLTGNIGIVFFNKSNFQIALEYFEKALIIAENIGDKIGNERHLCNIGNVYLSQSKNNKALEYFEKALKSAEEFGDQNRIGYVLVKIGNALLGQTNNSKALEFYQRALKSAEESGDKFNISNCLNCIGNVYNSFSNYSKALEFYERAQKISEEIRDKTSIGRHLSNIGTVYLAIFNYPKALESFEKALRISEEIENKRAIGNCLGNIGFTYYNMSNYPKALEYLEKALKINEEAGNKGAVGLNLGNIGSTYRNLSNYSKSIEYLTKSIKVLEAVGNIRHKNIQNKSFGSLYLAMAQDSIIFKSDSSKKENLKLALSYTLTALANFNEINAQNEQKECEQQLSKIYETMGDYRTALNSYKKAELLKDSIFSQESKRKIANLEVNKELEIKNNEISLKAKENELLKQKNENQNLELTKQKQEVALLNSRQALQKAELDKRKAEIDKRNGELKLLQKDKDLTNLSIKANEAEAKNKANEIKVLQASKREQELEIKSKNNQLYASFLGIFSLLLVAFIIYKERKKSEELLLNVLPAIIAKRLKKKEHPIADHFDEASIVFIDIVGFTKSSADQDPKRVAEVLNIIYTKLDQIAKKWGLEKIKTIGDCYMAAAGVPVADPQNAEKAANFATEAMAMLKDYDTGDGTILRFRCGIDCGPVVAGVIGEHKFIYDVWGDTVNMAARMEQNGEPDKVHVTSRFQNKITSSTPFFKGGKGDFSFTDRGEMEIKGKGMMKTYFMN